MIFLLPISISKFFFLLISQKGLQSNQNEKIDTKQEIIILKFNILFKHVQDLSRAFH